MHLQELLNRSQATEDFKRAVQDFAAGRDTELITLGSRAPRIKVVRVLMKLLEHFPDIPMDRVHIEGHSSCSAFTGVLTFGPEETRVRFHWDCLWKAEQEGLRTWYGAPDQTLAAQRYGYQCFQTFEVAD